jgi:hypothetical protein
MGRVHRQQKPAADASCACTPPPALRAPGSILAHHDRTHYSISHGFSPKVHDWVRAAHDAEEGADAEKRANNDDGRQTAACRYARSGWNGDEWDDSSFTFANVGT